MLDQAQKRVCGGGGGGGEGLFSVSLNVPQWMDGAWTEHYFIKCFCSPANPA
jgi:hypothetical protein